jgi:cupin fold WbuC family metalloprotein
VKTIDRRELDDLSRNAAGSIRRRANWNLHPSLEDPVQRFCNAIEPGTYVRPHRHGEPARWELFVPLRGSAGLVTFEPDGTLRERVVIESQGQRCGAEIAAGEWHTLVSLAAGTVLFEIKPGPYRALSDKDFAAWAPAEGDASCSAFEHWFRQGRIGSMPPPVPRPPSR